MFIWAHSVLGEGWEGYFPSENNKSDILRIGFMNIWMLSSKALLVQDLIVDNKIDILGLFETWIKPDEFLALNEATPPPPQLCWLPNI